MSTRTDTTDFDFELANFCVLVRQKTYQKISLRTECIWPWALYSQKKAKKSQIFSKKAKLQYGTLIEEHDLPRKFLPFSPLLASPEPLLDLSTCILFRYSIFCLYIASIQCPRPYTFCPQADFFIFFLSYQNAKIGMLEIDIGHVGHSAHFCGLKCP